MADRQRAYVLQNRSSEIEGVFSSFEKADAARKEILEDIYEDEKDDWPITEFKIDV